MSAVLCDTIGADIDILNNIKCFLNFVYDFFFLFFMCFFLDLKAMRAEGLRSPRQI